MEDAVSGQTGQISKLQFIERGQVAPVIAPEPGISRTMPIVPGTADVSKLDAIGLQIIHRAAVSIVVAPGIRLDFMTALDPSADRSAFIESHRYDFLHVTESFFIELVLNGLFIEYHCCSPF